MQKKAISPLIATVLLIGFTIVLAAVVIQWGGQLVDKIKGQTEVSSDVNLICSAGLTQLEISGDVTQDATSKKVTIDNRNDQDIAGFLFRIYETGTTGSITVKDTRIGSDGITSSGTLTLAKFGVATYTIPSTVTATDLGVIPIVKSSDGKDYPCAGKELKKAF